MKNCLLYTLAILLIIGFFTAYPIIGALLLILYISPKIYAHFYFKGKEFTNLKESIVEYIDDCNELNSHIEDLRRTYANFRKTDYGESSYQNDSKFNYKKKHLQDRKYSPYIYECSKSVCDNAGKQPFKYICKYFNIKADEETLSELESVLNNFLAAEDGKNLSRKKHDEILDKISNSIPWLIKTLYKDRLDKELGFDEFEFDEIYFPTYTFRYVSAGGNTSNRYDVEMNIDKLERFVSYLGDLVKFRKSAEGQRRLMTPRLRKEIIERDDHTCQQCGNSTYNEPNLLLEVDHIIPIAKGGMTTEENLQTLCWKCNRSKGAKIQTA